MSDDTSPVPGDGTAVELFRYDDREIRTVLIDGEPWFVAADVCAVLEIGNTSDALGRLDDDERGVVSIDTPNGRTVEVNAVTEAGLYTLILGSRKPQARPFKRWITHEVLPQIRRTGSYAVVVPEQRAAELTRRDLALMVVAEADRADAAEARVAELTPSARSWDTLASGTGDYAVADAAKILSRDPAIRLGRNRLFTVLRELRWVYRQAIDQRHRAYQTAIDAGRLSEIPTSHYHPRTGELIVDPPQIRVTMAGLAWLHRHLGGTTATALDGAR